MRPLAHQLLGQGLHVFVEGALQLVHQLLDLGILGALSQGPHEALLGLHEAPFGDRHLAVLDAQRGVPKDGLDR